MKTNTNPLSAIKMLTLCVGAFFWVSCGTERMVTTDKNTLKKGEAEVLAFTQPRYSVVAFRPHTTDDTYSAEKADRQKMEMTQLINFFGGYVTDECPVLTIADEAGYIEDVRSSANKKPRIHKVGQGSIRFANETGTYYFDRQPEKRKKPFGVVVSDGVAEPRVYWGTEGYLEKVKKQFTIKTYADFQDKRLVQQAREQAARPQDLALVVNTIAQAAPAEIAPLTDEACYQQVSEAFIQDFLRVHGNARWLFNSQENEGIRKKVATETPRGNDTRVLSETTEWFDRYGFPERRTTKQNVMGNIRVYETEYKRSPKGLIIQETEFANHTSRQISEAYHYHYAADKIVKYREKGEVWQSVKVYYLNEDKRVYRCLSRSGDGPYDHEERYGYDDQGRIVRIETEAENYHKLDLYQYDRLGRTTRVQYAIPLMEASGNDGGWEVKTTYVDDERKSESVYHYADGAPSKTTTFYDGKGKPLRIEYAETTVTYRYTYY